MLERNQKVLEFLLSRRSHSARTLTEPAPNKDDLELMLTAASRCPDHGKMEPWRFIVLQRKVMPSLANKISEIGNRKGLEISQIKKNVDLFLKAPMIVVVVFSPKCSDKIPIVEQKLSTGAVCLALLNAAHAAGWGANWLTGWMARDEEFLISGLQLERGEFAAGFIHIGTPTKIPLERPRPDIGAITSWLQT
ncbi:MAG: nitroreductase [Pseudomonadota bacterium]|nr:nitroreductase [Pseudomonadota bacterium]